jgi:putative inorganic carbon (HCO3(-)) transporter
VFSFYALIYFLPISIALSELFIGVALLFYLMKRGMMFYVSWKEKSTQKVQWPLREKGYAFVKAFKPVTNCLNWPITVFLVFNFFSIFLSQYPYLSFEGFMGKSLQSAFLYFNFVECVNSRKRLRIFLTVFSVSSALICINGIYQYFAGYEFIRGQLFDGRVSSSFRQANDFAAYLVATIPVLFGLFAAGIVKTKKTDISSVSDHFVLYFGKLKIFSFMFFVIAAICLGLTYSRGAWVAFCFSLGIFAVLNRKLFLPFVLTIIIFFSVFYPKLLEERLPINSMATFYWQNNRLGYWQRALDIIKDYPVFGAGTNTYSLVSQRYINGWGGYPHNSYLQLFSETGLIGTAMFFWILTALFKCSFHAQRMIKTQSLRMLLVSVSTGFLGFLIHSFFDTNFYSVQLGSFMWLLMGLTVAVAKIGMNEESVV